MMSQLSQSCETNMYAADTKTNPLHKVTMSKYLGMFINFNLKWDDHINNMTPKISAKISILSSYRDAVYDSASQTSKTKLEKLQTRATRLITGSGPFCT